MIHFNETTRTFNLLLKHSFYAFQVDEDRRVVHLAWGPRPESATPEDLISGQTTYETYSATASFERQFRPDELLTYGDVSHYKVTLKVSFPSSPKKIEVHEAPHLPMRDVRLRYDSFIDFYKRIRHIIQDGVLYRLERLEEFGASVIQYVLADGTEAVYSAAIRDHQVGSYRPAAPLKGINPRKTYIVLDRHNADVHRASGYELMMMGIPRETTGYVGYSRTLYLRQI